MRSEGRNIMIVDFVKYALKNVRRDKRNITLVIIMLLLMLLLFIDFTFMKNFNGYFDYAINKNIGFRTFFAFHNEQSVDLSSEEIKNVDHVVGVYNSNYRSYPTKSDISINGLDGTLTLLYGTEDIAPESIVGKQMKNVQSGEMICPYKFYPNEGATNLKIDESKILSLDESLNLEFNVTYFIRDVKVVDNNMSETRKELQKKFKIVGLYDSSLIMNFNNQCYITAEDMKFLQDAMNPPYDELFSSLHIVVDEEKNVEKVQQELKKMGYEVDTKTVSSTNSEFVVVLKVVSCVLFIILLCAAFFIFSNYVQKKIKNEKKYLGILRACGYTDEQVILMKVIENILLLIFSFIISLILFILIFNILSKKIFYVFNFIGFKITYNLWFLFLIFLSVLFIFIIMIIRNVKRCMNCTIREVLEGT